MSTRRTQTKVGQYTRRGALGAMGSAVFLGGCATEMGADPTRIAAARFVPGDGPYVSLLTMVNRSSSKGAHTGLLVNASERVIYDPAGTFSHPDMPERGDVHFGATDRHVDYYQRYHARYSHFVHTQKVPVSAATAQMVLERTFAQGPSSKAFCTINTARILKPVPGFTHVTVSIFPEQLRRDFARIPGVEDIFTVEEDEDKVLPTA